MASLVSLTFRKAAQFSLSDVCRGCTERSIYQALCTQQRCSKEDANFLSSVMWASPEMRSPSAIARKVAQPLELTYIYGRSAHLVCKENRMQGQVVDVHTF